MQNNRLAQEYKRLLEQDPIQEADYHYVTFLGTEDGKIRDSVSSTWAGFTKTKPRREIRQAVLVDPQKLRLLLISIKEPGLMVNDQKDLSLYLLLGGHGIIEKLLAERFLADLIKPREVAQSFTKGWLEISTMPEKYLQRAPSKKLRMTILKRDRFKCKVCGRSPNDHVDIELHVHHILPWGQGGITEEDNLITLCSTCHDGLDPHYELQLFSLINVGILQDTLRTESEYTEGIRNYRRISFEIARNLNE
jgi:hypothetical protein